MQRVYVIGPETGPYKVGISSDVEKRLTALQTGNPHRLAIHFEMAADDARALEARFHAMFNECRLTGEWFDADIAVLKDAIERAVAGGVEVTEDAFSMSPVSFVRWLGDMRESGLARSDAACARLLGVSANSVVLMKRSGADRRTALACRALLHRLEPYS